MVRIIRDFRLVRVEAGSFPGGTYDPRIWIDVQDMKPGYTMERYFHNAFLDAEWILEDGDGCEIFVSFLSTDGQVQGFAFSPSEVN